MGRKNKAYYRDLKQQIYDILYPMLKAGEGQSKKDAVADGTDRNKIFSYNTYHTYRKHCNYFANYIREHHPECTTLKSARKYVPEWLQARVDQVNDKGEHLSAWTITLEREALGKLYGIQPDDPNFFVAPRRRREDIKRSRTDAVRDKHFSVTNNAEFIKFCQGTGCRRNVITKLKGKDLFTRDDLLDMVKLLEGIKEKSPNVVESLMIAHDALNHFTGQDYFIYHETDKGGRNRFAPIIGPNKEQIIARMKATKPDAKVWQHVPANADIHGYRGDYATAIYKMYARPIEEIPYDKTNKGTKKKYKSEVYVCRKDEKGKKLDKRAMLVASKALGHNRLEVVANNYLRGL